MIWVKRLLSGWYSKSLKLLDTRSIRQKHLTDLTEKDFGVLSTALM